MNANAILKIAKTPMKYSEAIELRNNIIAQMFAEQESRRFHDRAQVLRLEIQNKFGFGVDEYYQFLQETK